MNELLIEFVEEFDKTMDHWDSNTDKLWVAAEMINDWKLTKDDLENILVTEKNNIDVCNILQPIYEEWEEISLADECVEAILEDLTDRSGLGNAWESIDEDIQNEIKETWANIIERIM